MIKEIKLFNQEMLEVLECKTNTKRGEILTRIKEIKQFNQEMLEVLECKREKPIRSTQTKKILPRKNSLSLWPHLYLKKLEKMEANHHQTTQDLVQSFLLKKPNGWKLQ